MSNRLMEGFLVRCRIKCLEAPVYLSGPMSGCTDHNYPKFNEATTVLRSYGLVVYNPAENFGGLLGLARKEYMRQDIGHLLNSRCVVVLSGWKTSPGARLEVDIARELDLPIWAWMPHDSFVEEVPTDA